MDKVRQPSGDHWPRIILWITISLAIGVLIWAGISIASDLMKPKVDVWLGDELFQATLADDEADRQQGLAGVERLGDNQAMLFSFDRDDTWSIWMKGMKIPIDIIWLDRDKNVVHIERNVQPDAEPYINYQPETPARYVIETAAGASSRAKLDIGDQVKFNLERQQ